jgi:hypothetical protein
MVAPGSNAAASAKARAGGRRDISSIVAYLALPAKPDRLRIYLSTARDVRWIAVDASHALTR